MSSDIRAFDGERADYRHRIVVPKGEWFQVATALAQDIDYPNFKSEVHGERDRDDAYMDVWTAMHDLQQKRARLG